MTQLVLPFLDGGEEEIFNRLREEIDEVCRIIAEKYHIFDFKGRPKKSFILDVLARHFCPCCMAREFTLMRKDNEVDALYREGHSLSLNLLIETLRYALSRSGINAVVDGEVSGEYGRPDVIVRAIRQGILLELGNLFVTVEVKTGSSISLLQIFKYALERPRSILVVWRVKMRQIFVIDMRNHSRLLLAYMFTIINRGRMILSGAFSECHHDDENNSNIIGKNGGMEDPQRYIDDLFSSLINTLPRVVEAVINIVKEEL